MREAAKIVLRFFNLLSLCIMPAFEHDATTYSPVNASWLADAALLAYSEPDVVKARFDLKNGGVGYVPGNLSVPSDIQAEIDNIQSQIKAGTLTVPATVS